MRMVGLASAVVALAALGVGAQAAPITGDSGISFNGYVQAVGSTTLSMATGLDFVSTATVSSPGVPGALSSYGAGSGVFAGLSCTGLNCGTIQDLASLAIGAQNIANFVTLTGGSNSSPIIFGLTGITLIDRSVSNFLSASASGTISYNGFDATPAAFYFSAQGNTLTSFSASIASQPTPTPEPASLALLGGALATAAMLRFRKSD